MMTETLEPETNQSQMLTIGSYIPVLSIGSHMVPPWTGRPIFMALILVLGTLLFLVLET